MNYEEVEKLVKLMGSSTLEKLQLETKDGKITLINSSGVTGSMIPADAKGHNVVHNAQEPMVVDDDSEYSYVTSPLVGVFKMLDSVNKDNIAVGDKIEKGQTICVIEAMKLINEIESDISGEVIEVMVQNGDSVEFGQKLFKIKE
ncbi:MAG: acetyl-CoA carboxylase, biotin carboxyl carrier protein [Clostridiales bacterium]|nr:acetyl-CoA carboxylase, biotin carboxyl carrier protein [Clostridiales bacterium]